MGNDQRTQFTFYRSFFEAAMALAVKDRLKLFEAICSYALDNTMPQLSGAANVAFVLIKPTLDASRRKAAAGRAGGSQKAKNADSKTEANCSKVEANGKQIVANDKRGGEREIEGDIGREGDIERVRDIEGVREREGILISQKEEKEESTGAANVENSHPWRQMYLEACADGHNTLAEYYLRKAEEEERGHEA